jgi:predicted N-acyltransferase
VYSGQEKIKLHIVDSILKIGADEWDRCLLETPGGEDHPFLSHRHLSVLERCGAIHNRHWKPQLITVRDADSQLLAAVPLFAKGSSFADFMEERNWASQLRQAKGQYYPKLLVTSPYAPVTGPRLLIRKAAPPELAARLVNLLMHLPRDNASSGIHATFVNENDLGWLKAAGFHLRPGIQIQWENQNYRNFEDFLGSLTSSYRSMIRTERRRVAISGITIESLSGGDIRDEHMDTFSRFYRMTFKKNNRIPHLPPDYFFMLKENMAHDILLVMARDGRKWIGGTLNFVGRHTIFVRSWGGDEGHPLLYFEVTHYQAMDHAIRLGLHRIDGGLGGVFKLKRGYRPVASWSAHHFADPRFNQDIGNQLATERQLSDAVLHTLTDKMPYRRAIARPAP